MQGRRHRCGKYRHWCVQWKSPRAGPGTSNAAAIHPTRPAGRIPPVYAAFCLRQQGTAPTPWHHGGCDDPTLTYQVGMAPNAKWIACKGCEERQQLLRYSLERLCADMDSGLLAVALSNRPNIVNNSGGGGGGDTWYLTKVQSWRAAGIFSPRCSPRKSGSTCGAIVLQAYYQESFATANHQSDRVINSSSGRGPSTLRARSHTPYPIFPLRAQIFVPLFPLTAGAAATLAQSMAASAQRGSGGARFGRATLGLLGRLTQTFQLLQNSADAPNMMLAPAARRPTDRATTRYGYGYLNVLAAAASPAERCNTARCRGMYMMIMEPSRRSDGHRGYHPPRPPRTALTP